MHALAHDGGDLLQKVARSHGFAAAFLQMAIDITRHHHERWDGKGYPDRLHDEAIPLSARFVAIADVYDALRARRPHKPALSHGAAVEVLTEASQGQFDPNLVQVFRSCSSGAGLHLQRSALTIWPLVPRRIS